MYIADLRLPFDLSSGLGSMLASVNLSLQGAVLIVMLVVIGLLAWKGFENIFEPLQRLDLCRLCRHRPDDPDCRTGRKDRQYYPGDQRRFIGEVLLLAAVAWLQRAVLAKTSCLDGCGRRGSSSSKSSRC